MGGCRDISSLSIALNYGSLSVMGSEREDGAVVLRIWVGLNVESWLSYSWSVEGVVGGGGFVVNGWGRKNVNTALNHG